MSEKEISDGFGNTWTCCDRPDCDLVVMRPGKVQCKCEFECFACHGHIEYHHEPPPQWPGFAGWFCPKCGPFPEVAP